jgi:hypothetical protein
MVNNEESSVAAQRISCAQGRKLCRISPRSSVNRAFEYRPRVVPLVTRAGEPTITPAALVIVLNRYMTAISEPMRRHTGVIDKYIDEGDHDFLESAFTVAEQQARFALQIAVNRRM